MLSYRLTEPNREMCACPYAPDMVLIPYYLKTYELLLRGTNPQRDHCDSIRFGSADFRTWLLVSPANVAAALPSNTFGLKANETYIS